MTYARTCSIDNKVCWVHPDGLLYEDCLECPTFLSSEACKLFHILEDRWEKDAERDKERSLPKRLRMRIEKLESQHIETNQGRPFLIRCYKIVERDIEEGNLLSW